MGGGANDGRGGGMTAKVTICSSKVRARCAQPKTPSPKTPSASWPTLAAVYRMRVFAFNFTDTRKITTSAELQTRPVDTIQHPSLTCWHDLSKAA